MVLAYSAFESSCGGARSLLNNCGISDCERGGCDDEARRPSISAVICKEGATKSARSAQSSPLRFGRLGFAWTTNLEYDYTLVDTNALTSELRIEKLLGVEI